MWARLATLVVLAGYVDAQSDGGGEGGGSSAPCVDEVATPFAHLVRDGDLVETGTCAEGLNMLAAALPALTVASLCTSSVYQLFEGSVLPGRYRGSAPAGVSLDALLSEGTCAATCAAAGVSVQCSYSPGMGVGRSMPPFPPSPSSWPGKGFGSVAPSPPLPAGSGESSGTGTDTASVPACVDAVAALFAHLVGTNNLGGSPLPFTSGSCAETLPFFSAVTIFQTVRTLCAKRVAQLFDGSVLDSWLATGSVPAGVDPSALLSDSACAFTCASAGAPVHCLLPPSPPSAPPPPRRPPPPPLPPQLPCVDAVELPFEHFLSLDLDHLSRYYPDTYVPPTSGSCEEGTGRLCQCPPCPFGRRIPPRYPCSRLPPQRHALPAVRP
jgi:hypothetical protein